MAFRYFTGTGKLIPVRWNTGVYFPERTDCYGYTLYLRPGVTGTVQTFRELNSLQPYEVYGLHSLNFNDNLFTGLNNSRAPLDTVYATTPGVFGVPYKIQGVKKMFVENFAYQPAICNSTDNSEYQNHKVTLAYVSEIWEDQLCKDRITGDDVVQVLTGAGVTLPVSGFIRCATLQCATSRKDSDVVFGPTGAPYYGIVAAQYAPGLGEIQYLNDKTTSFVPSQPGCIRLSYYLKPGVTMTATLKVNPGKATGISSRTGRISFVDGDLTGL
jgi:hypothetical protein